MKLSEILRYEPEIFREDRIRMEIDYAGDWVKYSDVLQLLEAQPTEVDADAAINETNAVLAGRYFDLLKVVEAYEKNGVTCQTFRHFVDAPCAECNSTLSQAQPAAQQEPSPDGVMFAVEQAIKNGNCPWEIEVAYEEYERERQAAHNIGTINPD